MKPNSKVHFPGPAVKTTRHPYDLGDPEVSTLAALRQLENRPGCYYVNPHFVVSADRPAPEFFWAARRAQGQWCRILGKPLGSSNRRRNAKWVGAIDRMLLHTGLLLVGGVLICPKNWESLKPWNPSPPSWEKRNGERLVDREPPNCPDGDRKDESTK